MINKIYEIELKPYPRKLWFMSSEDWKKEKKLKDYDCCGIDLFTKVQTCDDDSCNGLEYRDIYNKTTKQYGFFILFKRKSNIKTIMHECLHVAIDMFEDIGSSANYDDQEPFVYFASQLFYDVYTILKKNKLC